MSLSDANIHTLVTPELITEVGEQVESQHKVLVHLKVYGPMQYRIWPTTYLFDQLSDHRSALLHVESLILYPDWAMVDAGKCRSGLLVFEALPKSCTQFDFREVIPEPGAFEEKAIIRNESDIYTIEIR